MRTSRLSEKGQVTLPKELRETIGLEPGDLVAYEVKGDVITITRVPPFDAAFHSALSSTLDEWSTPDDDEAFRDHDQSPFSLARRH